MAKVNHDLYLDAHVAEILPLELHSEFLSGFQSRYLSILHLGSQFPRNYVHGYERTNFLKQGSNYNYSLLSEYIKQFCCRQDCTFLIKWHEKWIDPRDTRISPISRQLFQGELTRTLIQIRSITRNTRGHGTHMGHPVKLVPLWLRAKEGLVRERDDRARIIGYEITEYNRATWLSMLSPVLDYDTWGGEVRLNIGWHRVRVSIPACPASDREHLLRSAG